MSRTKNQKPSTFKPVGRPTLYSKELAERICELTITHTQSLKRLSELYSDIPSPDTVYKWLFKYPEFSDMYDHAKEQQMRLYADETIEISDGLEGCQDIAHAKLRVDTRKWHCARLMPKRYGEKIEASISNESLDKLHSTVASLEEKLKQYERNY